MRLIDADKLPTKHGVNVGANYGGLRAIVFKKDIDNAPTVDPVKHGCWERYLNEGLKWRCSECASRFTTPFNYCPNCGAKMTLD